MLTPAQVAKLANAHPNSVRKWSADYAEFLSPAASGEHGPRLYTEQDVETIRTIAALRNSNVPPAEVAQRLRNQDVPPVIEVEPTQPYTPPLHEPTQTPHEPTTALQGYMDTSTALHAVTTALQAHSEATQRRIATLEHELDNYRKRDLWTHGVAFHLGMVTMGVIFFFVWWLVNGV